MDGQALSFGPQAQEAMDGLVSERRGQFLWIGNVIEAHRRWTYLLSMAVDDNLRHTIADASLRVSTMIGALSSRTDALTDEELKAVETALKSYQSAGAFQKIFVQNRSYKTESINRLTLGKANWNRLQEWYTRALKQSAKEPLVLDITVPTTPGLPRVATVRSIEAIGELADGAVVPALKLEIYSTPFGTVRSADQEITYCLGWLALVPQNMRFNTTPLQTCGFKSYAQPYDYASGLNFVREQEFSSTMPPVRAEEDVTLAPWSGSMRLVFYPPTTEQLEGVPQPVTLKDIHIQVELYKY